MYHSKRIYSRVDLSSLEALSLPNFSKAFFSPLSSLITLKLFPLLSPVLSFKACFYVYLQRITGGGIRNACLVVDRPQTPRKLTKAVSGTTVIEVGRGGEDSNGETSYKDI